jgi:hypothetical protein
MEQLAHFAETQLGRLNRGNVRTPAELSPGNDISFEQPS